MRLELALQIGMALLCSLGTLMLGLGERTATLPVVAAIVAASSVWLTDVKGWLKLNPRLADLFGVAALAFSAWDFQSAETENQLLIVANLMVYLQFILQYQEKTPRTYWLLALLSLMQAAVSTALNLEMRYGALMLVYSLTGMATMTLFLLHREGRRLDPARARRIETEPAPLATETAPLAPVPARSTRWPLSDVEVAFTQRATETRAEVDRGLLFNVVRLYLPALLIAGAIFVFIPRLGRTEWRPEDLAGPHEVGFTERVQLGSLGPIIENPAGVMRVRFRNLLTGQHYPITGEVLLRGVVLNYYERGSWHFNRSTSPERLSEPVGEQELVEQEITIEPSDSDVVFSIYPLAEVPEQHDLDFNQNNRRLQRSKEVQHSRFTYQVVTTGLRKGTQVACTPESRAELVQERRQMPLPGEGGDPLAGLRELAADIVSDIDPQTPGATYRRARMLENFFRTSSEFQYSLNPTQTDPKLDPIEDFLVNTKQGHCEYYASALVLMLRSVGVPARMVVGYKGGDWNDLGDYLLIRQLHAHAWVEAYVDVDELPPELRASVASSSGAWLRLDPTPGGARGDIAANRGVYLPLLQQMSDYAQFLWAHYVMGMDARRQEEVIYAPMAQATNAIIARLRDPRTWSGLYAAFVEFPRVLKQEVASGNYFNWRLILVLSLGLVFLLFAAWFGRRGGRRLWRWWERTTAAAHSPQRAAVEFYHRLEQLLSRRQLERGPNQTQYEFARAAELQLGRGGVERQAAAVPQQVVDAFYRVRFGRRSLDRDEAEAVENALAELERALADPT